MTLRATVPGPRPAKESELLVFKMLRRDARSTADVHDFFRSHAKKQTRFSTLPIALSTLVTCQLAVQHGKCCSRCQSFFNLFKENFEPFPWSWFSRLGCYLECKARARKSTAAVMSEDMWLTSSLKIMDSLHMWLLTA